MSKDSTKAASNILLGAEWHDSIEACVRTRIRGFIEEVLEVELSRALGRARYERGAPKHLVSGSPVGHRNGHRDRQLMGTFGATTVSVPRARLESVAGETTE